MPEYTKTTDKLHKIKLSSEIIHAFWGLKEISCGEKIDIEVYTHFVGEGSDIEINIYNKSGSKLDTIKGKVNRNCFKTTYVVSTRAKEGIYYEAVMPRHGVKKRSDLIKIVPPRSVSNARWLEEDRDEIKKKVRRGDIVRLSADTTRFPEGTQATFEIFEYDQDGVHDPITKIVGRVHKNKAEVLWRFEYHKDTDDIPTQEEMKKYGRDYNPPEYFFKVTIGGCQAKSELLEFRDWIEIRLQNEDGEPVGNVEYVLKLPNGEERKGQLDENGYAREEDIPPGKCKIDFPKIRTLR